jgi:DnaA family protein
MKQLVLDIAAPPPPSLANFLPGRNAELLYALTGLVQPASSECQLYLWGDIGSGKTHLLHAAVAAAQTHGLSARYASAAECTGALLAENELLALDNVEQLDPAAQISLFNRINAARGGQGRVLVAGSAAPAQLDLRPDLTTRLGWGLVYQLHALSDIEKAVALTSHAAQRGFDLQPGVAEYLLRHWRRDLPSLMAALDTLDHYSLETQRLVTVPLLREVLRGVGE